MMAYVANSALKHGRTPILDSEFLNEFYAVLCLERRVSNRLENFQTNKDAFENGS